MAAMMMQQWTRQWRTITTKASSGRCSFPAASACCAASSSSFSTTATSVCNDTPTRSSLHDGTQLTSPSFDCTPLLPLLPLTDLVEGSTPACSLCDLMFYALVIGTAATNIFLPSFDFRGTLCGPLGFYAQVCGPTVTLPSVGCGGYTHLTRLWALHSSSCCSPSSTFAASRWTFESP